MMNVNNNSVRSLSFPDNPIYGNFKWLHDRDIHRKGAPKYPEIRMSCSIRAYPLLMLLMFSISHSMGATPLLTESLLVRILLNASAISNLYHLILLSRTAKLMDFLHRQFYFPSTNRTGQDGYKGNKE